MRVLLLYQFFGPYHLARWRHWQEQAQAAGLEPMAVQIFSSQDFYQWPEAAQERIVNLRLATNGRDELRLRELHRWLAALRQLQPNLVIVVGWGTRDAVLTHLWCRMRGIPRILITDTHREGLVRSKLKDALKRWLVRDVAGALVGGVASRRYLKGLGVDTEFVIDGCNVVDNEFFSKAVSKRDSSGYRLLTLSRLLHRKNLLAAGEAFLEFVQKRPTVEDWTWTIAGYGPLESDIRLLAERSRGRVRWVGAISHEQLPEIYADSDLFWMPSLDEPWGLAVNEAMAAGLPVLVSNHCGCHEDLVTPGNGWTFNPTGKAAMVAALCRAAADHQRWPAMGAASSALVAHWGLERFSAGLLQLISRLTAFAGSPDSQK